MSSTGQYGAECGGVGTLNVNLAGTLAGDVDARADRLTLVAVGVPVNATDLCLYRRTFAGLALSLLATLTRRAVIVYGATIAVDLVFAIGAVSVTVA